MSPNTHDMPADDDIFELTDVVDGGGSGQSPDDVDVSFEQELEDLFSDDDDLFSGDDTDMSATLEYNADADEGEDFGSMGDDLGLDDDDDGGGIDFEATMAMDDIDFSDLGGGLGDDDMDFDTALKAVEDKGGVPPTPEVEDDFSLELDEDDGSMDLGVLEEGQESMDADDMQGETMELGDLELGDMDSMDLGDDDDTMELGAISLDDDSEDDLADLDAEISLDEADMDDIAELDAEISLGDTGVEEDLDDEALSLGDDMETMDLDEEFSDGTVDETTVETASGLDELVDDLEFDEELEHADTLPDAVRAEDPVDALELGDLEDLGDLADIDDSGDSDSVDMSLDDDLGFGDGIELTETMAPVEDIPLSQEEEDMLSGDLDEALDDDTVDEMIIPGAEDEDDGDAISLESSMIVEEDEPHDTFDLDGSIPLDETLTMEAPMAPELPDELDDMSDLEDLAGEGDIDLGGEDDFEEEAIDFDGSREADPLDDTLIDEDGIEADEPTTVREYEAEAPLAEEPGVDLSAFTERIKGLEALARERLEAVEEVLNDHTKALEQAREELDTVKASLDGKKEELEAIKSALEEKGDDEGGDELAPLEGRINDLEEKITALGEQKEEGLSDIIEDIRLTANAASMAAHETGIALEASWKEDSPQALALKVRIIEEIQGHIAGEITALEGKMSEAPDFSKVPDTVWQRVEEEVVRKLEELVAAAVKEQVDVVTEEIRAGLRATLDKGMEGQLELSASAAAARVVREELANLAREMDM